MGSLPPTCCGPRASILRMHAHMANAAPPPTPTSSPQERIFDHLRAPSGGRKLKGSNTSLIAFCGVGQGYDAPQVRADLVMHWRCHLGSPSHPMP